MNQETLKLLLQRDKFFLKNLYEGDQLLNLKSLKNAEDTKLKSLIYYLHFLTKGEIHIKKEIFEKIPSYIIKLLKRNFESKSSTSKFIQQNRPTKIRLLNRLSKFFNFLLYPLFNE